MYPYLVGVCLCPMLTPCRHYFIIQDSVEQTLDGNVSGPSRGRKRGDWEVMLAWNDMRQGRNIAALPAEMKLVAC